MACSMLDTHIKIFPDSSERRLASTSHVAHCPFGPHPSMG